MFVPKQMLVSELKLSQAVTTSAATSKVNRYTCLAESSNQSAGSTTLLLATVAAPRLLQSESIPSSRFSQPTVTSSIERSYNNAAKSQLTLLQQKQLPSEPLPVAVAADEPLKLRCSAYRGWPQVQVQWRSSQHGVLINVTHHLGWFAEQLDSGWVNQTLLANWPKYSFSPDPLEPFNQPTPPDRQANLYGMVHAQADSPIIIPSVSPVVIQKFAFWQAKSDDADDLLKTNDATARETADQTQLGRLTIGPLQKAQLEYFVHVFAPATAPELLVTELHVYRLPSELLRGRLSCQIQNPLGTSFNEFHLRTRGRPDPPRQLRSEQLPGGQVKVQWAPGFNGGLPQQFRLHYFAKNELQRLLREQEQQQQPEFTNSLSMNVRSNYKIRSNQLRAENDSQSVKYVGGSKSRPTPLNRLDQDLADASATSLDPFWHRMTVENGSILGSLKTEIDQISQQLEAGNASQIQLEGLRPDTEYVFLVWAGNRLGWTAPSGRPAMLRTARWQPVTAEASGPMQLNERMNGSMVSGWMSSDWLQAGGWLLGCACVALLLLANSVWYSRLRQRRKQQSNKTNNDLTIPTEPFNDPSNEDETTSVSVTGATNASASDCDNNSFDIHSSSKEMIGSQKRNNDEIVAIKEDFLQESSLLNSAFTGDLRERLRFQQFQPLAPLTPVSPRSSIVSQLQSNGIVCNTLYADNSDSSSFCATGSNMSHHPSFGAGNHPYFPQVDRQIKSTHCPPIFLRSNPLSVMETQFRDRVAMNGNGAIEIMAGSRFDQLNNRAQQLMQTMELIQMQPTTVESNGTARCKLISSYHDSDHKHVHWSSDNCL